MSDQEEKNTEGTSSEESTAKSPVWKRVLTKKRIAMLVGAAVIVPAVGYAAIAASGRSGEDSVTPEVSLGAFWYETTTDAADAQIRAEFKLHLQLLEQVGRPARERLEARRFKVQQDIEELLRRAHNGDFEDPSLTELKRQIQVQINQTLGMRGAIEEVIVTGLVIDVLETKVADEKSEEQKESIYRNLDSPKAEATPETSE